MQIDHRGGKYLMRCRYTEIIEREKSKSDFLNERLSLRVFNDLEEIVYSIKSLLDTDEVEIVNEWKEDLISTVFVTVDNDKYKIRFCRCKDREDRTVLATLDVICLKG